MSQGTEYTTETEEETDSETEDSPLTEPTDELAEQITRKVSWEERFEGRQVSPGPGGTFLRVYSLEHMYGLLENLDSFRVDFDEFAQWVETVLGDEELASEIRKTINDNVDTRSQIVTLLSTRLNQCKPK